MSGSIYHGTACASQILITGQLIDAQNQRGGRVFFAQTYPMAKIFAEHNSQHSFVNTHACLRQVSGSDYLNQPKAVKLEALRTHARLPATVFQKLSSSNKFDSELRDVSKTYENLVMPETVRNGGLPISAILQFADMKTDLQGGVRANHSLLGNSKKEGRLQNIIFNSQADADKVQAVIRGNTLDKVPAEARVCVETAGQYRDLGTITTWAK